MATVRRNAWGLIAVVVVIVALAGCAAGPLTAGGRTLLVHASSGASADAALSGVLGVDGRGCIAVGEDVLVVPTGSTLHADGSITVGGKTFRLGERVALGGGLGGKPSSFRCAAGSTYWYV